MAEINLATWFQGPGIVHAGSLLPSPDLVGHFSDCCNLFMVVKMSAVKMAYKINKVNCPAKTGTAKQTKVNQTQYWEEIF